VGPRSWDELFPVSITLGGCYRETRPRRKITLGLALGNLISSPCWRSYADCHCFLMHSGNTCRYFLELITNQLLRVRGQRCAIRVRFKNSVVVDLSARGCCKVWGCSTDFLPGAEADGRWFALLLKRCSALAKVPRDVFGTWTLMINILFAVHAPSVNIRGGQRRR
jgi:hypothetical protein